MPSPESASPRHVSLAELAASAGVSLATASRVMRDHGRVSEAVRVRVKAVAERLGYRPNPLVSSLMHQIRERQVKAYQGTIAFVTDNASQADWEANLVGKALLRGAEAEAARLGFQLERLQPRVEGIDSGRLIQIIEARGMAGALLMEQAKRFTQHMEGMLEDPLVAPGPLPVVLLGHKELRPKISFVMSDQYANARFVGAVLRERGYARPLLVNTLYISTVTEHRFEAGLAFAGPPGWLATVLSHGQMLASVEEGKRLAVLERSKRALRAAIKAHKPDVVVSLDNQALGWLRADGHEIPRKLGYVTLEWEPDEPEMSGLEQCHETVGALGMRQLSEHISRNERGPQNIVSGRLIEGHWHEGKTLRGPR
jgi:LacI family transcriptional regulator